MKFCHIGFRLFITFSTLIFFSTTSYGYYTGLMAMPTTMENADVPRLPYKITVEHLAEPHVSQTYEPFIADQAPCSELLLQLFSANHPIPTKDAINCQSIEIEWLIKNLKESLELYKLYALPSRFARSVLLPTKDGITLLLQTVSLEEGAKLHQEILALLEWAVAPNTTDTQIKEELPEKKLQMLDFTWDGKISEEKNDLIAQNHLYTLVEFLNPDPLYHFIINPKDMNFIFVDQALCRPSGRYLLLMLKKACSRNPIRKFCIGSGDLDVFTTSAALQSIPGASQSLRNSVEHSLDGLNELNVFTIWVYLQGSYEVLQSLHDSIEYLLNNWDKPHNMEEYKKHSTNVAVRFMAIYLF